MLKHEKNLQDVLRKFDGFVIQQETMKLSLIPTKLLKSKESENEYDDEEDASSGEDEDEQEGSSDEDEQNISSNPVHQFPKLFLGSHLAINSMVFGLHFRLIFQVPQSFLGLHIHGLFWKLGPG